MATLSAYMAAAAGRTLPPEVVEKTKQHILDTFAAMISGSELPPGRAAIAFARAVAGGTGSIGTVAGSRILCGPLEAALANGVMAHADETDDSHGPSQSHPGAAVVPAALAAAEQFGVDGTGFIRAVALGYDIGPRVTMALGGVKFRNESHRSTHSIAGTFGASAAAGCVARLNAQQMRWLLDYAAQQASGFAAWERDTDHIEKGFVFGGMPARNGVTAALVVSLKWSGVDDVFSGEDNFFEAMSPAGSPAVLVDRLGERYEVTRTDIKKWTVGSPIQAPLDALDNLLRRRPFEADQVQRVVVRLATSAGGVVNNREIPDICLQHMVAVMLLDKTASFAAAHDKPRMQDPAVLKQRAKVELVLDEELERLMPQRQAIVEDHLERRLEAHRARRGRARHRRQPDGSRGGRPQVPRPDGARSRRRRGRSADPDSADARKHPRRPVAPAAAPAEAIGCASQTRERGSLVAESVGMMTTVLACPVCGAVLTIGDTAAGCPNGHTFDLARSGYLNLLPSNRKRSAEPGDSAAMLLSRRAFLRGGFYDRMASAANTAVAEILAGRSRCPRCGPRMRRRVLHGATEACARCGRVAAACLLRRRHLTSGHPDGHGVRSPGPLDRGEPASQSVPASVARCGAQPVRADRRGRRAPSRS